MSARWASPGHLPIKTIPIYCLLVTLVAAVILPGGVTTLSGLSSDAGKFAPGPEHFALRPSPSDSGAPAKWFVPREANGPGSESPVVPDQACYPPTYAPNVAVGLDPDSLAYDPSTGEVFVGNDGSNNLSVISDTTNTVTATIPGPSQPVGLAFDSAKAEVYVGEYYADDVSVVSAVTDSVVSTIPIGTPGYALHSVAYDSGQGEVFVTVGGLNTVSVISDTTNTVVATVPVQGPNAEAYDSAKGEVFVAGGTSSANVSVISDTTNTVVATIPIGAYPEAMAYDGATGEIFVTTGIGTDETPGYVSIISDTSDSVVRTIPVGPYADGVAYDAADGDVYVASASDENMSVISGVTNTVVSTLCLGQDPTSMVFDPGSDSLYVANFEYADVSVFSLESKVTFTTIPSSCGSITFNGTGYADGQSVNVPGGTYLVSATSCAGYTLQSLTGTGSVSVVSGQATVSGAGGVTATFVQGTSAKYAITFATSPTTCGWIIFDGTSYTDGESVDVLAGSYSVSTQACTGYSLQSLAGTGSITVSSGKATVSGAGRLTAEFSSSSSASASGFLGLAGNDGYYVLGGLVVAVVVAIAGVLLARRTKGKPSERSSPPGPGGSPPPSGPP